MLSDWGGVHSTVASALAGLDQEMPGAIYFGAALKAAVAAGTVPRAVVDAKALRVLTAMFTAGLFDMPQPSGAPGANCTSAAHTALARDIAAAGTVLLANDARVLPLGGGGAPLRTLAVLGDAADAAPQCCGAGSGYNNPPYIVTPLAGIAARAGAGTAVTYTPSGAALGALHTFFSATRGDFFLDFTCEECYDIYVDRGVEGFALPPPASARAACDAQLDLYWDVDAETNCVTTAAFPPPPTFARVRALACAFPLSYSGPVATAVLELWRGTKMVGGVAHATFFTLATAASRAVAVAAGRTLVAAIARVATAGDAPGAAAARVAAAAAAADAAVLVVATPSSEGSDRPNLDLSPADAAIVAAVLAAQPRTVVVLNSPAAIVMPWAPAAGAIVHNFFPGQEMGSGLADILFGDVNPAGRLPFTVPMRNEDNPLPTPAQYPGINGTVTYSEGLFIDYRWFQAHNVTPRYAFGHGLSYTTFAYAGLVVDATSVAPAVRVSFTITNTGARAGREVPQLYVNFPAAAAEPPWVLRGFSSVELAAGASAPVALELAPRDLSVWDAAAHAWARARGDFRVRVGASSSDTRLEGAFSV